MPRSSRHKSHKQSKHSSKDAKEYSDSEGEDVKVKDSGSGLGSGRVSKESGHLVSGEKRKLALQLKEGKDLFGHGNGDAGEEYVSSKRRKEKADTGGGGDRWNGGGDEKRESGGVEKESRGESLKFDGEKGAKSRESKVESKSRGSRRHESGVERKEENVGLVVEKEESRSGSRSESKRKSEKEKDGKVSKEVREKERGSEREKKGQESKRDSEVHVVDGNVLKKEHTQLDKFGEDKQGRKSRNDTEVHMQAGIRNPELEKESEKRVKKKREGSGDLDKYQDGDERRLSSKGDRMKEGKYRDEKHKEGNYGDMYQEDVNRDDRHREKFPEDIDRDNKHRDVKYKDDVDRDNRHRDDKYRDGGDRDSRRREEKYHEDGDRENRRRDDKYRENGEKDSRSREDKYRDDGERVIRRRDEKYKEEGEKESRSSDVRYYEDIERDGRLKDEKYREDGERDNRHKEDRHRDDYERESRQRDAKQGDDVDKEKRLREAKYRDERGSKDRSGDKSVTKRLRDENSAVDIHSRKSSGLANSPGYDDRITRYKDDQGRRKTSDKEDHSDFRTRNTKDQLSDAEKRSAGGGRLELVTDRGRSASRNADMDLAATHSRRRNSPSSSSHVSRDQHRLLKQDESKYRDYAYEDRARHREYAGAGGSSEKKLFQKDDNHFGESAVERRLRSNVRNSPLPLMDKSPSSTSAERRHLNRSDVRRSLDVEESGQRSGGSKDGKDYSGREGRGSREVAMETFPGDELSQADGDNLSVSSPFTRKSLLPPPSFRPRVDSPSPYGAFEDESRGKSNNRHRRIGDPNIGRVQGNSWRGVPNWPSPMTNGYMPFQHGPPPVGFHHVMQQFPGPSIFSVRPSMELNHPGVPYHVPDADRFAGHIRPMAWRNPGDDSGPPSLHGWDSNNNAVFSEDSHLFGRSDWDNGRNMPSGRSWETNGDMWKGPSTGVSAELHSGPTKENHFSRGEADGSLAGLSGQQALHEGSLPYLQADSTETSQQSDFDKKRSEPPKFSPEETTFVDEKLEKDDGHLYHVYLSKLDISGDLTEPELYVECTGLLDMDNSLICDVQCTGFLEHEAVEDRVATNKVPFGMTFAAPDDCVFQKAMTLYKKHKEEFKVTSQDNLTSSIMKNEPVITCDEENLGSEGEGGGIADELAIAAAADEEPDELAVAADELAVPAADEEEPDELALAADKQESENVPPNYNQEVELPANLENIAAANVVDKTDAAFFTSNDTSMEVQVNSNLEARDQIIDKEAMSVDTVEQVIDHSTAEGEDKTMHSVADDDMHANNNEGTESADTECGPLLFSDVPEACEVVMAESIESETVNLTGIQSSPESTR